jgi:uncharacterized protein
MSKTKISAKVQARVEELLGRAPRGLEAIAVSSDAGDPMVIRVASLVDGKPFPTLFWLIDRSLNYAIDKAEAGGLIQTLQGCIDADPELQESMKGDHLAHIQLRNSYLSADMKQALEALGFYQVLQSRGIGGIADFSRIRCLHTWYGAHLVVPNTVGRLLDEHWSKMVY